MKIISLLFGLLTFIVLFQDDAYALYSLNDATIFLPIPKSPDDLKTNYLNPATALASGPLLTAAKLKAFDWTGIQPDIDLSRQENVDRLAAVGIRLDPCFKARFTDSCRPQIRLVMQPIVFNTGHPDTADTAIHLFFESTQDEVLQLIQWTRTYREKKIGQKSFQDPLTVHPILQSEGSQGKFWQGLRAGIQKALGQAKLIRVAFAVVRPSGRSWTFRSFNFKGDVATPLPINGMPEPVQNIDNHANNDVEFESTLLQCSMPNTDQTFDFLSNSVRFKYSDADKVPALKLSLEHLENPHTQLPALIDCLSCHSAPSIENNFQKSGNPLVRSSASFVSTTLPAASLVNPYQGNYENHDFRMLGYRNGIPMLGQRVINETALIVDGLNVK